MTNQDLLSHNKAKLEAEKSRLEKLLSRIARRDTPAGDFHAIYSDLGNKEDDNALEFAEYESKIAEGWDLEQHFRKVTDALSRIKSGSYGICSVGGEEIDPARLKAVPEAETCVEHDR